MNLVLVHCKQNRMEVQSFLSSLLATTFLIVPRIFAEADIGMNSTFDDPHDIAMNSTFNDPHDITMNSTFDDPRYIALNSTFDDPHDIALNKKSFQLANNSSTEATKIDLPVNSSSSLNLNHEKKIKAYSAVLVIKPVELKSDWETEFSSIILDNLVDKDPFVTKRHGLKKIIRESEDSHKLVVIPMANAITSFNRLVHIIEKRVRSSLFPKQFMMPRLEGAPELIRMIPSRKFWTEIKIFPDTHNNSKKLANDDNIITTMKPTASSNQNEKSFISPLFRFRKYTTTKPTERHTAISSTASKKEPASQTKERGFFRNISPIKTELVNEQLAKQIGKLLDGMGSNDIEIVAQSPANSSDKKSGIDINIYKTSAKESKESADKSKSGIIHNVVFLRLFPKRKPNRALKPKSNILEKNSNLFRSFKGPSLADSEPNKIKILNAKDFNGIMKTEEIPMSENRIKSGDNAKMDGSTAMSLSNVLENYPASLTYSPIHINREILKMEELPKFEEFFDAKGSALFHKPLTFLKPNPFPGILWDEDVYNEIKQASMDGNDLLYEKTSKTIFQ